MNSIAEQYGIDLIAKVSSADSQFVEQFDSPNGELELDAEDIYLFSDKNRKYILQFTRLRNMLTQVTML